MYVHDEITIGERTFRVRLEYDDCSDAPWENDCIYEGVVSEWERRSKRTYERILCEDRGSRRFFNVREFIATAIKQGCTRKQAAEQMEPCFERLRLWCNDQWHYVGVIVELLDDDGDPTGEGESIWGIEDDCAEHINETAQELAEGIVYRLDKENSERTHWAERDTVTV